MDTNWHLIRTITAAANPTNNNSRERNITNTPMVAFNQFVNEKESEMLLMITTLL